MTDRVRSQPGNVIAVDFSQARVSEIEFKISAELLFSDGRIIVMRCTIGSHSWHMLGDAVTGEVISTN